VPQITGILFQQAFGIHSWSRDGERVRCFTRGGHDLADRFPAIVDAAFRIKVSSFLIDGEAMMSQRRGSEVVRYAFDLFEDGGSAPSIGKAGDSKSVFSSA
jgi:hypothetical protein